MHSRETRGLLQSFSRSSFSSYTHFPVVFALLVLAECALSVLVVRYVPCNTNVIHPLFHYSDTEIDWIAYMQEVEGVLNGTMDYMELKVAFLQEMRCGLNDIGRYRAARIPRCLCLDLFSSLYCDRCWNEDCSGTIHLCCSLPHPPFPLPCTIWRDKDWYFDLSYLFQFMTSADVEYFVLGVV